MIILEGPDHSGKTTAAKKIEETGRFVYRHMDKPEEDFDWSPHWFLNQMWKAEQGPDVVQDRFHFGGLVYGVMCGLHDCKFTFQTFCRILERVQEHYVILFLPDEAWIESHYGEKPEMFEDIHPIVDSYRILFEQETFFGYRLYDAVTFGFPTEEEIKTWILNHDLKRSGKTLLKNISDR